MSDKPGQFTVGLGRTKTTGCARICRLPVAEGPLREGMYKIIGRKLLDILSVNLLPMNHPLLIGDSIEIAFCVPGQPKMHLVNAAS